MSTFNQVQKLYNENSNLSRKDFIALIVNTLGMKENTASVYHNKCKKNASQPVVENQHVSVNIVEKEKAEPVNSKAALPLHRVAKNDSKPLHNFDMSTLSFTENDVPAFLKKSWEKYAA